MKLLFHSGGMIYLTNLISVDLGFSFCKAIINGERYMIKSVVGDGKQLRFEDLKMQHNDHDYITSDIRGRTFFVSDLAIQQSKIQLHSLKADRFDEEATKILVNTLFGMGLGSGKHRGVIVSGLPVFHYSTFKENIKDLFLGEQIKKHDFNVNVNGEHIKGSVSLDRGQFIPQPFGAFIDVLLDDKGDWKRKDLAQKLVAVIDIGFGTSDVYVCNQMEPADDLSFSSTTAMNTSYSLIAREITEHGGGDYSGQLHKLEDFVRQGYVNIHGKRFSLKNVTEFAFEQTARQLISEIHNKWHNESWRIDEILLSGGGGIAFSPYFQNEFPNIELIEDAQWSVVRGYEKWGKRQFRDLGGESIGEAVHVSTDEED